MNKEGNTVRAQKERYLQYLDYQPTVIDYSDFGHNRIELADCGVGLRITGYDRVLRDCGEGNQTPAKFEVGLVSVSWGILTLISRQDIFRQLLDHVTQHCGIVDRGTIGGRPEEVWYSMLAHLMGAIHVVTVISRKETDIRLNRELYLRASEYFLD